MKKLMACYMSGDACRSRIFGTKLQTLLSNHGDQRRVGNMISIYPNGCNFVVKGTLVLMKQLQIKFYYFCMTYFRVELSIV